MPHFPGIFHFLTGVLHWMHGVVPTLSQGQTNGASLWGTLSVALLPFYLTNNPLPNGYPWGTKTSSNTNPYMQSPTTGVIRTYDFTISRGVIAPDGFERPVLLVNGAFPGPKVEANWGDIIQVTLHNNITGPEEGTHLHWHGFLQTGTPWEDGVPGLGQCPLAPGKSYTYQVKAELYGTSWYHSHYSAQYSGGAYGPIVIYGPKNKAYDVDVGPVMLNDWYHEDYNTLDAETLAPGGGPVFSDNNLINGKMNFDCSTLPPGTSAKCTNNAGISQFKFTTGKTHRLRLINSGSEGVQRFSIDQHTLTVIANDFVEVQPYNTTVVTLGVGQRTDILVTANAGLSNTAYWMRSNISSCARPKQPYAVAAIYYDKADTSKPPTSTPWNVPDPGTCVNDDLSKTVPVYQMPVPNPSNIVTYSARIFVNGSGVALWDFDEHTTRLDFNAPPLLLANQGNLSFPADANIRNLGTNSSVRIIVENETPVPHPIHLHGYNMFVLAEGEGSWNGVITNPSNPQRRDVQQVRTGGHLVLQFNPTNPGIWPLHCHIAWHASAGFAVQLLVQPEGIKKYAIPSKVAQVCRDWAAWTNTDIPDQIDSGM